MRLFYGVMLLAFFTSGCVTVETRKNVEQVTAVALPDPFVKVVIGMTHEEVTALLNDKVILGYEVDPLTETVRPIEVSRLYASEVFSAGEQFYQVDQYIAHDASDGTANVEADLFPLAYKDGILVAKGPAAVEALKTP